MTPELELQLLKRTEELLVQVRVLGAQLHAHIEQQRVRDLLQQARSAQPNLSADEIAEREFELSKQVRATLEHERARIEEQIRAIVRAAAAPPPATPEKDNSHLN